MRLTIFMALLLASGLAACCAKPLQAVQQASAPPAVHADVIELTLHPAAEPVPSLKYKLVPDEFELKEGNAAVYYLKALGFLEQNNARRQLYELEQKGVDTANEKKLDLGEVAPFNYTELEPAKYPIEEVKKYLALTSFQPPMIAEAASRRTFAMDRQIKDVKNPVGYLLPEIQVMRDLARKQSVRCRLAIAENRIDDAITILGQQFALARHIGQDDFVVSTLVGCAIEGIAIRDAMYLIQLKDCPNLFWAFASLPDPMHNWQRCLAYEKHFIELQFPQLAEVTTQIKSNEYWRQFIDRLNEDMNANSFRYWDGGENFNTIPLPDSRAIIVSHIAASYPEARAFLLEHKIISQEAIDSYPTAQLFFLAMKHHLKLSTDDVFKWLHMPLHVGRQQLAELDTKLQDPNAPAFTRLSSIMASVSGIRSAQIRTLQRLGTIQAVEGLRMHASKHQNNLPDSLEDLQYPIGNDPASGKPFQYTKEGNTATLSTTPSGNYQIVLKIRIAGAK